MDKYFSGSFTGGAFELFSTSHLAALILIIALNGIIFIFRERIRNEKAANYLRYILALILILQEISYNLWHAYIGNWSLGSTLPLHLCGISVVLSAVVLLTQSYKIYEIVFFWGIGGASMALLTPDVGIYGFPHYRYFQFFISHGSIVTACLFATFVFKFRPNFKSLWRAVIALNIYTILIAGVNALTRGNYLYISSKPATASLMDYLGPWPWYIVILELLGLILFLVIYSPFALQNFLNRKRVKDKPFGVV